MPMMDPAWCVLDALGMGIDAGQKQARKILVGAASTATWSGLAAAAGMYSLQAASSSSKTPEVSKTRLSLAPKDSPAADGDEDLAMAGSRRP